LRNFARHPPRAQRQGRAIRGRQARVSLILASRAAKWAQFFGASNARIFFASDARGAAPRRLQCTPDDAPVATPLPSPGAQGKDTAAPPF